MKQPVRILHVLDGLGRGGAETMVMNLYRNIDRDRYQFDFAVCADEKGAFADEILALGGKIHKVPRLSIKSILSFKNTWIKLLREHSEYAIIHGHLRSSASIYLTLANRFDRITIAHSHSTSSGNGSTAAIKNILQLPIRRTADYMFACTQDAGVWLYGKKAVARNNFFVLHNAVDARAFAFDKKHRALVRQTMGLGDELVIGHVGSFISVKNHRFVIDIFEQVQRRNPKVVLLLVGDGGLRQQIAADIERRGLFANVIMTGDRADVSTLLQAMDVFVLPSKWEGLPVTVVEAQASGLPCLLSDTISGDAQITPLVSCLSLSDTPGVWANKLLALANGHVRQNMADTIINAGYDTAQTTKWLQEFYQHALKSRKNL